MKRVIIFLMLFVATYTNISAQEQQQNTTVVYCDVTFFGYSLFNYDLNAMVDFGIADKAKHAKGWIYNNLNNKRMSFSSPMNIISYMAKNGWRYKDTYVDTDYKNNDEKRHYILEKVVPYDYTTDDVVGNIDYRYD